MRDSQIQEWVRTLTGSFGKLRPAVQNDEFQALHAKREYAEIIALLKRNLRLDMQLRLGFVNSGGPKGRPSWIVMPAEMPLYGTQSFRNTLVTLYFRKTFLAEAPCGALVVAAAHELSHVVLAATRHPLRETEEAADLTAMLLGYHGFFLQDSYYLGAAPEQNHPFKGFSALSELFPGFGSGSLGYLTQEERCYAFGLMRR